MQNRILLIIVVILAVTFMLVNSSTHTTIFCKEKNHNIIIKVKDSKNGKISELELEDYIVGVVAAEMPASFNTEALKAQAVASRTYAVYKINSSKGNYDVVTDVTNQGYISKEEMQKKWGNDFYKYYEKIKSAVKNTNNLILKYNNEVIEAYYFSMSNGYTENSSLVFSEDRDYLQSVESNYETSLDNFKAIKKFAKSEFCKKLNIDCTNIKVGNIERSATNRVNNITINGVTFKGTNFRKLLNLRSTDFTIVVDDEVEITTKGYGHGVGMSQYGANGMASNGSNYKEILEYYYKNVQISSI